MQDSKTGVRIPPLSAYYYFVRTLHVSDNQNSPSWPANEGARDVTILGRSAPREKHENGCSAAVSGWLSGGHSGADWAKGGAQHDLSVPLILEEQVLQPRELLLPGGLLSIQAEEVSR